MGHRSGGKGHGGADAVVVSAPERVRNVVLVGHSGAGKTTLVESLLATAGAIARPGSVVRGTTVCDFDPSAVAQQRSVALSVASLAWRGVKVNLLDTPGFGDFVGEVRAGLRGGDAVLFVVSAGDGVDASTIALWHECAALEIPRAVAVTRLDHARADFDEAVAICQRAFGDNVLPVSLPLWDDEDGEHRVAGVMDLLSRQIHDHSGPSPRVRDADPEHLGLVATARAALIEGVIAESEDEDLLDSYLAGEEVDPELLRADLRRATAGGFFYPALPVCTTTGVGAGEVLDLLVDGFPSPTDREPPAVRRPDGTPHEPLAVDPDGPLAAEVIKTTVDPYVGRVCLVRVFSGTLRHDEPIHVSGHDPAHRQAEHDVDERAGHLFNPLGATLREVEFCVAGDVCAVTKSAAARAGDTISRPEHPLLIEPWPLPEPMLPVAVVASTRADSEALARNLGRVVDGDPTLRLERNAETGQLVLWCVGEAHAEVVLDRLRAGGVGVETESVRVAMRETFTVPARGRGRHVKQSGGHGQFAVCEVEVEPLPRGAGVEFVEKVVGGAVPRQYIGAVEKGVREQLARGVMSGHPVVDVRVTLVDGKAHSVDSSEAAFAQAGALAVREAAAAGGVGVMEPVDAVEIVVPDVYVGHVMSDVATRHGRVLGTEPDEDGRTRVRAEVPAARLTRYATELRSLSAGTGSFTRSFARYEPTTVSSDYTV